MSFKTLKCSLRVINSFCVGTVKGNCRGQQVTQEIEDENTILAKRARTNRYCVIHHYPTLHVHLRSTGRQVKTFRSNNGGEYISREFTSYLAKEGIRHELTTPYTPQQYGIAERLNRMLIEGVHTMLTDLKLPRRFWAEALSTMMYLRNLSPTKALEWITPHEVPPMKRTGNQPLTCHVGETLFALTRVLSALSAIIAPSLVTMMSRYLGSFKSSCTTDLQFPRPTYLASLLREGVKYWGFFVLMTTKIASWLTCLDTCLPLL